MPRWAEQNYGISIYFDEEGYEIEKKIGTNEYKAYVKIGTESISYYIKSITKIVWAKAPMPKIISGFEEIDFQQHDFLIASQVFIFNKILLNNQEKLPTTPNHSLSDNAILPYKLQPTLIKAICMRESRMGLGQNVTYSTGKNDIMQVNNSGDWAFEKESVGLTKNLTMTPQKSLNAGIKWLYLKGLISDINGKTTWRDSDRQWKSAVLNYKGGSDEDKKIKYQKDVYNFYKNSINSKTKNYE